MVISQPPNYSGFTYDSSISNKTKEEMTMDEYKQWVMNEMSQMPVSGWYRSTCVGGSLIITDEAFEKMKSDPEWEPSCLNVLQFDVLKFRLENEYNVDIRLENLPYEHIRWIENKDEVDVDNLTGTSDMKKVIDMKGNPLLLFVNEWSVGMTLDRNEGLVLAEFSKN